MITKKLFLVILFILIILMVYLNFRKYTNKETFNDNHNSEQERYNKILNIKSILKDTSIKFNCDLTKYTYPFSAEGNDYFTFISDYTFSKNSNIEELEFKNQRLTSLHSKSFYGLKKLKSLDLSGNNSLRFLGSDIFKNNLGGYNTIEDKEFIMTTPYKNQTSEQVILRDKIVIAVYPETLYRLFTISNIIYNKNTANPELTIPSILDSIDSSSQEQWSISQHDLHSEDDIRDMIIYRYFYEVIPRLESEPEKYKKVVLDLLGVNDAIIMNNKFSIKRKTREDDKDEKVELTSQDYVNNFRIVYFKDIFFDTDLAYFRTKYYNLQLLQNPHLNSNSVPDIISKYTKNYGDKQFRKSLLEIFEEIIINKNYKNYLLSQNVANKVFNSDITKIEQNNSYLTTLLYLENYDINEIFIPQEIYNLFYNISITLDTCKYDNGNNCVFKTGVLNENGNFEIPDDVPTFPVLDIDMVPPFKRFNPKTTCNNIIEEFQSGSEDCPCYAYKYNLNVSGNMIQKVILTDINPALDKFFLLYRLTKVEQMNYLLKYIKILRSLDRSLNINNIDNLFEKQIVMLSNYFYNIPTQLAYINNDE